ncbi:MAG TPA: polysaccharide deacetylase family protein [Zoogloea sp.]|jgi:peptidoglycan/xylan/chitin deacetylase (PgdA/CDA1 family)|nr:polysaccharide deacetylase family protein [Zoogloea sp.]
MASMKKGLSVALEGMGSLLGGNSKRLTVLIFHRVLPEVDPLSPDEMHASRFDALVGTLVHFFNVLPMDEALSRLRAGTLPTRSVAITFDDGYADNYTIACPILIKHGVKATFFVASGFLDGGIMWNDVAREALRSFRGDRLDLSWLDLGVCSVATEAERHRLTETLLPKLKYLTPEGRRTALTRLIGDTGARIPDDLMLTTAQLQGLQAAGMEIGGHTMDHPILAVLSEAEARQQMADNRTHLTRLLGRAPRYFAYPNGRPEQDYLAVHARIARELGYEAAFTTSYGSAGPESGSFELPRFTPWDKDALRFSLRLGHNFFRSHSRRLLSDEALV